MRLRLFPSETRSLKLLTGMSELLQRAVTTAAELISAPVTERTALREEIKENLHEVDDKTYTLLTHLRTSFINPLPREDLFTFSRHLRASIGAVDNAAGLIPEAIPMRSTSLAELLELMEQQAKVLRKVFAHLAQLDDVEDDWLDLMRLTTRGRHAIRNWKCEISETTRVQTALSQTMLLDDLREAHYELIQAMNHLGTILVKES